MAVIQAELPGGNALLQAGLRFRRGHRGNRGNDESNQEKQSLHISSEAVSLEGRDALRLSSAYASTVDLERGRVKASGRGRKSGTSPFFELLEPHFVSVEHPVGPCHFVKPGEPAALRLLGQHVAPFLGRRQHPGMVRAESESLGVPGNPLLGTLFEHRRRDRQVEGLPGEPSSRLEVRTRLIEKPQVF